ncbi:MAG: cupin domain-containing protein [Magnetovibrio sp.]|nr:cupin domain-containing protein [Magnetovibrio sp.]
MVTFRPWETEFSVEKIDILMQGADLRVLEVVLAPGECVPWHMHPETDDLFIGVTGVVDVHVKMPLEVTRLMPAERVLVPARKAHLAHNPTDATIRFLNVQGVGAYDYVPIGDQETPEFTPRPL